MCGFYLTLCYLMILPISHLAYHTDNLPANTEIRVCLHHCERLHGIIFRYKFDKIAICINPFYSGFAVDYRNTYLSLLDRLLHSHDNIITVKNTGIYHAFTMNTQHEYIVRTSVEIV